MMSVKGYLTTKEAAERLGLSDTRVVQMISRGQITGAEKFSGYIIPVKEVERLEKLDRKPGRPHKNKATDGATGI